LKRIKNLNNINGVSLQEPDNTESNYAYFPIFVDEKKYGMTRDQLYEKLKQNNIYGRRYFYPLISQFPTYRGFDSAKPENLSVAEEMAKKVICLPIYAGLHIE